MSTNVVSVTELPVNLPEWGTVFPTLVATALATRAVRADLADLRDGLMRPFRAIEARALAESSLVVRYAEHSLDERKAVAAMVRYAYCSRYLVGEVPADLGGGDDVSSSTSLLLLAVCTIGGTSQVVGSMGVTHTDHLDICQLFRPVTGHAWPHEADGQGDRRPGVLRRLSLHPLFDYTGPGHDPTIRRIVDLYKRLITHHLLRLGLDLLKEVGVEHVYCICNPKLRDYVTRCGLRLAPLNHMVISDDAATQTLTHQFGGYWQPDMPPEFQPRAYEVVQWELDPVPLNY